MCKPTTAKKTRHEVAESLHDALNLVSETSIPIVCRDRHIPRKDQAKLARALFKRLGLNGISVTTPNYSMAQSVHVELPKLEIHVANMWPHGGDHVHEPGCSIRDEDRCPTCRNNFSAMKKIELILAKAFPEHDDRSDTQSDYFDYCWSIS